MNQEFSLKELYDVSIKTTQQIEVGNYVFEKGETIAQFDKIQLANFTEIRKVVTANGGYENTPYIWWETVKDVRVTLTQGVFNSTQFAIMTNSKVWSSNTDTIGLPKREECNIDTDNQLKLDKIPFPGAPVFVYDAINATKVTNFTINGQIITIENPSSNVYLVDYYETNTNGYTVMDLHGQATNTYFSLTGRTRVKDDITGATRTAIIYIPQLKLMSDLSMRLGEKASPVLGTLNALACPTPGREHKRVMQLIFLNEDIDSDI